MVLIVFAERSDFIGKFMLLIVPFMVFHRISKGNIVLKKVQRSIVIGTIHSSNSIREMQLILRVMKSWCDGKSEHDDYK